MSPSTLLTHPETARLGITDEQLTAFVQDGEISIPGPTPLLKICSSRLINWWRSPVGDLIQLPASICLSVGSSFPGHSESYKIPYHAVQ
jgi:hypothetical protein